MGSSPLGFICPVARNEAENATLAKVMKLPLGEGAARLLTQIRRARSLFLEIEAFYKRLLEQEPEPFQVGSWSQEQCAARLMIRLKL